jgi:hypothetical protein
MFLPLLYERNGGGELRHAGKYSVYWRRESGNRTPNGGENHVHQTMVARMVAADVTTHDDNGCALTG